MKRIFLFVAVVTLLVSCGRKSSTSAYVMTDDNDVDVIESEFEVSGDDTAATIALTSTGVEETKEVEVAQPYSKIKASGAWKVMMSKSVEKPTIIADKSLMPYLTLHIKGDRLIASFSKSIYYRGKAKCTPTLKIPADCDLKGICLSGAAQFTSSDPLCGDSLEIDLEGASKAEIDASGIVKYIDMELAGACKVMLKCEVEQLDVELDGATKLGLIGKTTLLNVDMAGACKVNCEKDKRKFKFESDIANIEMAGASKIDLHCNNQLNIEAAGTGSVRYTGNPQVSQNISGVVSVKRVR